MIKSNSLRQLTIALGFSLHVLETRNRAIYSLLSEKGPKGKEARGQTTGEHLKACNRHMKRAQAIMKVINEKTEGHQG